MKKKKLWLVTGVAAAAVLAAGTVTFAYQSGSDSEEQAVYKEVTVEKGNLTAGGRKCDVVHQHGIDP